jgi:putative alpha-1,2-mannosidase
LRRAHAGASLGRPLDPVAEGVTSREIGVQSLSVNGASTNRNWLHFAEVAGDSTLQFTMGNTPNEAWGSSDADRPPSFGP